jgi:hypothetical protein
MNDSDLIIFYRLLKEKNNEELISLCLNYTIKIEVLKKEVKRLKTNNKIGKKRGEDEDLAFMIFLNYIIKNKKRPTLQEWNDIVGYEKTKWQFESLKVSDKEKILPNGLTKERSKGWYYRFSKDIKLFLEQKLVK